MLKISFSKNNSNGSNDRSSEKKSERVIGANQDQLQFEGFEQLSEKEVPTQTIPAHERKQRTPTGKDTIKLPEDLPMETTLIDIPEEEKVCQETGLPLQKIGEEVSHKLAHRPGSYFLKRIIRPKKASSSLPCQKAFSPNVEPSDPLPSEGRTGSS